MTLVKVPQTPIELPAIPMKRDAFLELLYKQSCGEWQQIMLDEGYLSGDVGNVTLLDKVWSHLTEPGPNNRMTVHVDELIFILSKLPIDYQWQLYQYILGKSFAYLAEYCAMMVYLNQSFNRRDYLGFAYSIGITIKHILIDTLKDAPFSVAIEAYDSLLTWFLPFGIDGSGKFEIAWGFNEMEDWLTDNLLLPFEGCPFYFEDDPFSVRTRYLREEN